MSGLIASQRTRAGVNDNSTYYVLKGEAINAPVLVNPVEIRATDDSTNATLFVSGASSGAYQGAINIEPGANGVSATPGDGITIRTGAGPSTIVDVGANSQANNYLFISGTSGSSQVNDGIYNPTIKSSAIFDQTLTFNSSVPGTSTRQIPFTITRAGAYMLQVDINFANADSTPEVLIPVVSPVNPALTVGAFSQAGGALEWTITTPEVQYMSSTITATSLIKASALNSVADPMDFTISNMGFFNAGAYTFNMYALKPLAGPNVSGDWILSGVKVRIVQMC
jgi:hypothetical protein